MSDELNLVPHGVTALASTLGAGGFMKWLLGRQAQQLDATLERLASSIEELKDETQKMRETHVGFSRDLGAMQKQIEKLEERQAGMSTTWAEKHDRLLEKLERPRRGR